MVTIKLNKAEAERLEKLLSWRVTYLGKLSTPEKWARDMWPIAVTGDMLANYKKEHVRRQQNVALYRSILGKLGKEA